MKKHLVQRTDDGSLHIIGNLAKDPGYTLVGQAPPEATHAADLDIITETDEMDMETTRIVINEARRQERLDAEALAKSEQEAKEKAKADKMKVAADAVFEGDAKNVKLEAVVELLRVKFGE